MLSKVLRKIGCAVQVVISLIGMHQMASDAVKVDTVGESTFSQGEGITGKGGGGGACCIG